MKLTGADNQAKVEGEEKSAGKVNYLIGNSPENWMTDIPTYNRLRARDIYQGIDITYYGRQTELEFDFIVAPHADPKQIKMDFQGAGQIAKNAAGGLSLSLGHGEVVLEKPVLYQIESDGSRREVAGEFELSAVNQVSFKIGAYDPNRELVIDPILSYSTFLPGTAAGQDIAVDAEGNAYVTGSSSGGVPVTTGGSGSGSVFVTKFNPQGSNLIFSTRIGGSGSSSSEGGRAIKLDSEGNVIVAGLTSSTNFPSVNPVKSKSAFYTSENAADSWNNHNNLEESQVSAIAPSWQNVNLLYAAGANRVYKSTDGGTSWTNVTNNLSVSTIQALAVNPANDQQIYVGTSQSGLYRSNDGGASWAPVTTAIPQTFPVNAIAFNTSNPQTIYLATGAGIRKTVDGGSTWMTQNTGLPTGMTTTVTAVDPQNPQIIYAGTAAHGLYKSTNGAANWTAINTGISGAGSNNIRKLAIDPSNPANVYVVTGVIYGNYYIHKTANGGASWSLFYTSSSSVSSEISAFAVSRTDSTKIYIGLRGGGLFRSVNGGSSFSRAQNGMWSSSIGAIVESPVTAGRLYVGAVQESSIYDAFVLKLNPSGNSLLFSTTLGGNGGDEANALAVDAQGNMYVGGMTSSYNFPTVNAFQPNHSSPNAQFSLEEGFVAKIPPAGNTLIYSTYLGGSGSDKVNGLVVDETGALFATGETVSDNFPIRNAIQTAVNGQDAFLTKIASGGSALVFSTYFGGSGSDSGSSIDVDASGNIVMVGTTNSSNFPVLNAVQSLPGGGLQDGFVSKFSAGGSQIVFSTYLGGAALDRIYDVDISADGSIYFAGMTASNNFPQVRSIKNRSTYFRSSDHGERWSNANTNNYFGIIGYAFHPTDPQVIIGMTTNSLVKTTDGGDTWSVIPNTPAAQFYDSIEFDPQNPNKIYLGYRHPTGANLGKLAVSSDGGQTWVTNTQLNVGSSAIFKIYVSPLDTQLMYVATDFSVNKTTDGGASWQRITPASITFIRDLAVNPVNPAILYIAQDYSAGGIHRSVDGGGTWVRMTNGITGFSGSFVILNPLQPATLYAQTGDGVFKTVDGGENWTRVTFPAGSSQRITFDPFAADTLYMTGQLNNTGGIYRSDDGGATWRFFNGGLSAGGCGSGIRAHPLLRGTLQAGCGGSGGEDIFVSKLNAEGTNLEFSSVFGGGKASVSGSWEVAYALAVSSDGSVFVTGTASTTDFPTTPGAYHRTLTSSTLFVSKLKPSRRVNGKITVPQTGEAIVNVDLTLAGDSNLATNTDGFGKYVFPNVAQNSGFVLTPRKLGYDFTPANHTVAALDQDRELNFTGTYITHTIRGRIMFGQNPLPNAAVKLSGAQSGTVLTDANGNFSFTVPRHGDYTVRPELYGYVFTPAEKVFSGVTDDIQADFAARAGYRISGRVLRNGNPFGGVNVILSGSENQTTTADAEGHYSFDAGAGGSFVVKAATTGFAFQPETHFFENLAKAESGDFNSIILASHADSITFTSEPSFNENQSEIYTVETETGSLRRLTQSSWSEGSPAWSKNGRQIAYISSQTGNPLLSVMDYEAKNNQTLVTTLSASHPNWSPDGTKIVFTGYESNFGTEIYVVGSDGTGLQRITTSTSDSYNPAWSPDGTKIAFARNSKIHLMNPDGTQIEQLTSGIASEDDPVWSPDSTQLAFVRGGRIYLIGRDGTNVRRLTTEDFGESFPAWSPDGSRIAYLRDAGVRSVYTINVDGTNQKPITISTLRQLSLSWKPRLKRAAAADFDGDGKSDPAFFRTAAGTWHARLSRTQSLTERQFGLASDKLVSADYDGDAVADIAVFRPESGLWYILYSRSGLFTAVNFGSGGDIPAAGDFDGDLKADIAVFRPETGYWYIRQSSDQSYRFVQFGANGDIPVAADYDGDGKDDLAVFRPSNGGWYISQSVNGYFRAQQFGTAGDKPVVGDFDGDGKSDIAVYRASDGYWYHLNSSANSFTGVRFGIASDIPASGDYDGDGRTDYAVFRDGVWYVLYSGSGNYEGISFGQAGDVPVNGARAGD